MRKLLVKIFQMPLLYLALTICSSQVAEGGPQESYRALADEFGISIRPNVVNGTLGFSMGSYARFYPTTSGSGILTLYRVNANPFARDRADWTTEVDLDGGRIGIELFHTMKWRLTHLDRGQKLFNGPKLNGLAIIDIGEKFQLGIEVDNLSHLPDFQLDAGLGAGARYDHMLAAFPQYLSLLEGAIGREIFPLDARPVNFKVASNSPGPLVLRPFDVEFSTLSELNTIVRHRRRLFDTGGLMDKYQATVGTLAGGAALPGREASTIRQRCEALITRLNEAFRGLSWGE